MVVLLEVVPSNDIDCSIMVVSELVDLFIVVFWLGLLPWPPMVVADPND